MKGILRAFARHTVFANILLLLLSVAGLVAAMGLVRETFPQVSLDYINVSVLWPGADPEEVEEGISRKIEEAIEGVEGIKRYNSTSSENFGSVLIEVSTDYEVDDVKDRVRGAVEAIPNLPLEAERPITEEILIRDPVIMLSLSGEGVNERQLKEWAESIKDELLTFPEISQVRVMGARKYEIGIEISEERLREYGLSFAQVAEVIRRSSLNLSGGTLRTQGEEIRLRTVGRKYTGEELAGVVVLARGQGDIITLDRIATIRDDFEEDPIMSLLNGEQSITVAILKTSQEDTIAISERVRAYVEEKRTKLPAALHVALWGDSSKILNDRIDLLLRNGLIGLALVFVLLWLFLDIRLSFWAGMGIPISIAGALIAMFFSGTTLNMISLFGLIMVLGIIVDDAIVVGESIYVARKKGDGPLDAAVNGTYEVAMPVLAAVLTTIVAFLPLWFIDGPMGRIMGTLPLVVISSLAVSLIESEVMLPAHLSHLPDFRGPKNGTNLAARLGNRFHRLTNGGLEWFVDHVYEPFITWSLNLRYVSLTVAITIFLLTVGLLRSGAIGFVFFPQIDSDVITVTLEFPAGTPLHVTKQAVDRSEAAVRTLADRTPTNDGKPLIKNIYSLIGSTQSREQPRFGTHLASVRVEILGSEDRDTHSEALMVAWEKEIGPIPGLVALTFRGDEAGPPGAAVEVWLQGHEMSQLTSAAADLKEKLASYDGVYQIQDDYRPGKNEIRFLLKPEARALGLTVSDLARQVYAGYFGEEALRLQRGRDDVRVRVRYTSEERRKYSDLEQVRIRTPQGYEVPLFSVANVEFGPGYATIKRTDGMRRVAVTAEVDTNRVQANQLVAELSESYFAELMEDYPGMLVSIQGEKERMSEALNSLYIYYPIALVGIYVIIATLFRSYIQPFLIMLAIPFGFVGAILGHAILGYDMTIMSLFGIVAMSGVVVNDSIVLVEKVNSNLAQGLPFIKALSKGGARRFRAIFLTTLTTVGGLSPLIMEKDMQAKVLIPMAISMAGGVAFSTFVTLVIVPCMMVVLNDLRRILHWVRTGRLPSPEEVEPAVTRLEESTRPISQGTVTVPLP